MIRRGQVTVNGFPIRDPAYHIVPDQDIVRLADETLDGRTDCHLMLYKPAGVLTAASDRNEKTVMDLLPDMYRAIRCMPVGRLDRDTTGLLLLTTDGELAHRLLSPRRQVEKCYIATVSLPLSQADRTAFRDGIRLSDFTAMPAHMEILSPYAARISLNEGKYHQIKRMFAAIGHEVTALHRVSFGGVALDASLLAGSYRELTPPELAQLRSRTTALARTKPAPS
jgi:16S rRNA pseudouridine516 synthase